MDLYFNYSLDCELPVNTPYTGGRESHSFFHGPSTWEAAENSVCGFIERMDRLGARNGATLFVYPDVARKQRWLYQEMRRTGIEVALHLNGLRYSRLKNDRKAWLGAMSYEHQREALRVAKDDLEQTLGESCCGYRACYGSANDDTFRICDELGFVWSSNAGGRFRPEYFADWRGSLPFPHRAHRLSKLIAGDLNLYEMPVTRGLKTFYEDNPNQPLDLRVETPPDRLGHSRMKLRQVMEENLAEMERQGVRTRAIIGASHNTNPFDQEGSFQAENLNWILHHIRELVRHYDLRLIFASFREIHQRSLIDPAA